MRGITIIVALALVFGTGYTFGQTGSSDSTSIKIGDVEINIGGDEAEEFEEEFNFEDFGDEYEDESFIGTDWFDEDHSYDKFHSEALLLDFGINAVFDDRVGIVDSELGPMDDLRYPKSYQVNLHFFKHRVSLIQRVIGIEYGATLSFNRFHFQDPVTLTPALEDDAIAFVDLEAPVKRSKLAVSYAQIPLLLTIETNPNDRTKSLHIAAGGFAGVKMGSKTKYVTEDKLKVKQRDDFNLNPWRYGLEGRLGYGRFTVYAQYMLSDMFESAAADEVRQVSAGIVIHGM